MEGTEGETIDGTPKLEIAVRCAKAAILLSSLKSSYNSVFELEEMEKMMREIENLRVALVKERLKIKKIKQCGSIEVILVILISSFFLKFTFDSFLY
ncbi:hypothetical protein V6N13_075403 [Hibiscus sabdariffa]|uniref:Uncharacterized protein n=1 Tax=Hibiscus sabdariffa TaxID=183260 RepID=A0ABR2UBC6_9ROSI